jgi:hypothetical protein
VLGWYVVRVEGLDVFWLMRANELVVVEWRSPPWAAAPAARKVVATMEKRILMVLCWVGMW